MNLKYKVTTRYKDFILGTKKFDSLEEANKYAQGKHEANSEWITEIKKVAR